MSAACEWSRCHLASERAIASRGTAWLTIRVVCVVRGLFPNRRILDKQFARTACFPAFRRKVPGTVSAFATGQRPGAVGAVFPIGITASTFSCIR